MSFEVVFFDAAGTLIHLSRGVGFHYADVARRQGVILKPEAVDRAFRNAWKAMPRRTRTHGPRPDDDRGWWRQLVDSTLDALPAPAFDRCRYFGELYDEFTRPGVWALYPEVPEVLSALSSSPHHSRLGIISNFDRRLLPILEGLGIARFFENVILSSEVGVDKPDPAIFHCALDRFGVWPEKACHVGDDPAADWQAARAAGLRVFELDRQVNDLRALLSWKAGDW
jgi:putative hydrolase of the HAD superfamily